MNHPHRKHSIVSRSVPLLVLAMAGCQVPPATVTADPPAQLPTTAEDWRSQTIYRGDSGVWYARVAQVVDDYAPAEIIAADDRGRFLVLTVYSGNWTAHSCIADGQWLAPSRPADVDPRAPGRELYAAGQAGSIHQVLLRPQPFARFTLESREIGHVPGEEFHAVLAADLLPDEGDELLAFAISGPVYRVRHVGDGGYAVDHVADVEGRVRDALATKLPGSDHVTLLGVSRRGDLLAMRLEANGLLWNVVLHEDQGLGRIAASPQPGVYYVTRDDGVLLRVAFAADGSVVREPILVTDQGLRGVAAGRFFADGREAVAVYGYNKKVQLVSRPEGGEWTVEDIYIGTQQGHWLTIGELDGRNGTDELVATGFDGEIVLLSRPMGYGLQGVAVSKDG
ncbi:MAG: hypothetical protein KDC98_00630 [Planctomycetes bacterium]|nr:hypothetical protein [Planctomycetota bacterium]